MAVLLAVGAGLGSFKAIRLLDQARSIREGFTRLQQKGEELSFAPGDLEAVRGLRPDLETLQAELAKLQQDPVVQRMDLLRWLPVVGGRVHRLAVLAEAGEAASRAAVLALDGLEALLSEGGLLSDHGGLGQQLDRAEVLWQESRQHLERALRRVEELGAVRPDWPEARFIEWVRQQGPQMKRGLDQALQYIALARQAAGVTEPRRYLIIAQNVDELRATGGFITAAWLLTLEDGAIWSLQFFDSAAVDDLSQPYPPPPLGLTWSLWSGVWLFRDATWLPDFPAAAQTAERLFALGQRKSVDGVIAISQRTVEELVGALGPFILEGMREPITAENVRGLLEQGKDQFGKDYLDTIFQRLLARFKEGLQPSDWAQLATAAQRLLYQKQLLLYFDIPELEDFLTSQGWDGSLSQTSGDYLLVIDSNVGFNRVNATNIQQSVTYQLYPLERQGLVTVTYRNLSTVAEFPGEIEPCAQWAGPARPYSLMKEGCYWDYLRVYVPLGSQLLERSSFPTPQESLYARYDPQYVKDTFLAFTESDKQVFSGFFVVPPNRGVTKYFRYRLPEGAFDRLQDGSLLYTLTFQKQAGTASVPAEVIVHLPQGWTLKEAVPEPQEGEAGVIRFSLTLLEDQSLRLVLAPPEATTG